MKNSIEHIGVVESVAARRVRVRILQASACATCEAAGLCKSSEAKEKIIDIQTSEAGHFTPGQQVRIEGSTRQGLRATLWAYIMPLAVVVVALAAVRVAVSSDALAALAALAAATLYYGGLYLLRHRLERTFTFTIQQL